MKGQPIFGRASVRFVNMRAEQRQLVMTRSAHRPTPDSMCLAYGPERMDRLAFKKEVHSLLEHIRIERLSFEQVRELITVEPKVRAELMEATETEFDREGLMRVFANRERLWNDIAPRLLTGRRVAA